MKIGIVGAGIGGLTVAALLQEQGHEIQVFEKKARIEDIGAGIGIGDNVIKKLGDHDLAKGLKNAGHILESMQISDDQGRLLTEVPFAKETTNLTMVRQSLIDLIATYVKTENIRLNEEVIGIHVSETGVALDFVSGATSHFDLVIGADGLHSNIRQAIFPDSKVNYQGYTCFRGVVEDMTHLGQVATEYWGRKGRFGIVPLLNGQAYWFATMNAKEKDAKYLHYNKPYLQAYFNHFPEDVRSVLDKQPETEVLHHDIYDLKPLKTFTYKNRVLLLGDAAHATTPNMGQGAGQAMEDAILLSGLFEKYDMVEALKKYNQLRVKHTAKVIKRSRKIGKIAQKEGKLSTALRNRFMSVLPNQLIANQTKFLNKSKRL